MGETVRIQAKENPSTGYEWIMEQMYANREWIEKYPEKEILLIKEFQYVKADDETVLGAPGKRVIEVQCIKPGVQEIRLAHVKGTEWDGFESVIDKRDTRGNPVHAVNLLCLEDKFNQAYDL